MEHGNEMIWVERYRPKSIKDCILPAELKTTFQQFVDDGRIPNLLLAGTQGTGKTTVARAMCEELGIDYIIVNASNEGRLIDTLRTKIRNYASSLSFSGKRKIVILDEADYLPSDTVQPALRTFMEEFSENCGFILTANFKNRIIAPLHSRCSVIDFNIPSEEKNEIGKQFLVRVHEILTEHGIEYDRKVVVAMIKKYFPDWRRLINEIQRYSANGKIDSGILSVNRNTDVDRLVGMMKEKNFAGIREWVFTNPTLDMSTLVRELDTKLYSLVQPHCVPDNIIVFADYQHKHVTAMDPEINILAMLVELMVNIEWK